MNAPKTKRMLSLLNDKKKFMMINPETSKIGIDKLSDVLPISNSSRFV